MHSQYRALHYGAFYSASRGKNCTKLSKFTPHNFAAARRRVVLFSANNCSETNCLHDKGQCMNTAI